MTPMSGHRIAVIGCGVAGSFTALLLQRQGHLVTVFEQAAVLGPVGAGVLLQPLGQRVLEHAGLLAAAIATAEPIHYLHAVQRSGGTLIRLPFAAARLGMHAYGVHRGDLFQALVDPLIAAGVTVVLGARVERITKAAATVMLACADGRTFADIDYVVVANGANSSLRCQAPFSSRVRDYDYAAIWCTTAMEGAGGRLLQVVDGTARLMGILPVGGGRVSLFWGLPGRDRDACLSQPLDVWKDTLRRFYPPAGPAIDGISDWAQASYATYRRAAVTPAFDERTLFLGDAALSASPHLGQGLNFALLDAARFAHALAHSPSWLEACGRFTAERRRHRRYYDAVTGLLTPFFQSDSAWRAVARDLTLPWLHRTPVVRYQMALTMSGMKSGFLGGRLEV